MEWYYWAVVLLILVCLAALVMSAMLGAAGQRAEVRGGGEVIPIQQPWFRLIKEGKKTVEGKPSPVERWKAQIGRTITFMHGDQTVDKQVVAVRGYPDLDTFLEQEWQHSAPQAKSLEDAKDLYAAIMMKWRENPKDGWKLVQVFSPERVSAKGGMTAIELSSSEQPVQELATLGQQLKKNKKAQATFERIWNFLRHRLRNVPAETLGALESQLKEWMVKGETDGRIVAALNRVSKQFPPLETVASNRNGRTMSRIMDIEEPLTALILSSHFPPITKYLDIGCAEGSLTGVIGQALGLRKESEIHGCDIFASKPKALQGVKFTYATARAEYLPYKDGEFQVVSCIMSLHHFQNLEQSLKEIRRVLAPGGLLLIREHDCPDKHFGLFLDFVHYFYAGVGGEIALREGHETEDFDQVRKERLIAWYRSEKEWQTVLGKAGFGKGQHFLPLLGKRRMVDRFRSFYGFYRRM